MSRPALRGKIKAPAMELAADRRETSRKKMSSSRAQPEMARAKKSTER